MRSSFKFNNTGSIARVKNKPKFEHLNLVIEGVAIQAGRRGAFLKMNTLGPMQFTSKLARTGKQVRLPIRAGKKMVLMRSILTFSSAVVGVFLLAAGIPALAQSDDATIDARVATLLSRMTLQDKINIIRGTKEPPATYQGQAGYLAGVPRLGIPALRLADGPPGVLTRNPSIAAVATMGLAATFDPDLAFDNGELIGAEARRLGIDVVLEPFININRDISFGRGYNTFGEDPVLTGTMGASQIRGIQSRGIMAMAKHYVAFDSNSPNIVVDPQTLREVYVAPFANAADAGVAAIMCSYNKINAEYACGNSDTLTGILRHEIGFKGFVSSDWGATHSSRQLAAGQDMEMPGTLDQTSPLGGLTPSYFDISPAPHRLAAPQYDVVNQYFKWGGMPEEPNQGAMDFSVLFPQDTHYTNISDALKSGGVVPAMIDRAASRVLGQMDRFGMLPGSPKPATPKPLSQTDLDAINLRTATEAAVLLKNDDHVLPLSRDDQASLAMIGPGAAQIVAIGAAGERALGLVDRQVSPFQAVRQLTGGEGVTLAVADDMTGEPVPANHLAHAGGAGLLHSQDGGQATVDGVVNFTTASGSPLPAGTSHRWSGVLRIDQGGDYRLNLQLLGLRGTLSVDGQPVAGTQSHVGMLHGDTVQPNEDNLLPTTDGLDNARAGIRLSAGDHPIQIDVEGDGSDAPEQVRLAWTTPAMRQAEFNRAVEAARHARKAIVFAWSRNRPVFGLPGDQDALIEAVAAVNPNTVVVLNISQPIAMPWLNKVRGVLLMW